ncbi:MAG: nucleotide exchange factor GrpE [Planctomycetes bacterium]|nr:nucleotide exchange factor GrpE [Planctomycetota bacterium]
MNDEKQQQGGPVDGGPAEEPVVEIPPYEQELKRIKEERDQFEGQLQRALADLQNIRRRQRHEIDDSRNRVLEGLTQELLPVLDTFSMALHAYDQQDGSTDPKALVEGVRMVRTMLSAVLERHGLQEITATGTFDPNQHEAVSVEPSDEVPEGHIVRVMQTGYLLGDRVVRFSRVVVCGNPAQEQPAPERKSDEDEPGKN